MHAWLACPETHPDAVALDLLADIMASGRSSRLYRRLVDQEQAAITAQAFPVLFEKAGLVGVFATGNRGVTLEKLDALIEEEVEKVKAEGVTAEEFTKALNGKEDELARENSQMSARARNLARAHLTWGDTAEVNRDLARYFAVKREDLQRVAKKYFVKEQTYRLHYPAPAAPAAK
jgi:predicted Zn-dependent peptidase